MTPITARFNTIYTKMIELILSTFEAEKRCLDKHAQPQLKRNAFKRRESMPHEHTLSPHLSEIP